MYVVDLFHVGEKLSPSVELCTYCTLVEEEEEIICISSDSQLHLTMILMWLVESGVE